jgi:hypothetical protein
MCRWEGEPVRGALVWLSAVAPEDRVRGLNPTFLNKESLMYYQMCLMLSFVAPVTGTDADVPDLKAGTEQDTEVQSIERAAVLPLGDVDAVPPSSHTELLGVVLEPVPRLVGHHLPHLLDPEQGLLVTDVTADSPAAKAGLKRDDILAVLDGHQLFTVEQLDAVLRKVEVTEVELGIIRRGRLHKMTAALDSALGRRAKPIEAPAGAAATRLAVASDGALIAISSADDGTYRVKVVLGDGTEHEFTGDRPSILQRTKRLPNPVQAKIERALWYDHR